MRRERRRKHARGNPTKAFSLGRPTPLPSHLVSYSVVRMIWWFLILGVSTLIVVCVAIALYMRLRRHLLAAHATHEGLPSEVRERQSGDIEH